MVEKVTREGEVVSSNLADACLPFAVCKKAFAVCFWHTANSQPPVVIANMQGRTCGMYGAFCLASYYHLVLDNII